MKVSQFFKFAILMSLLSLGLLVFITGCGYLDEPVTTTTSSTSLTTTTTSTSSTTTTLPTLPAPYFVTPAGLHVIDTSLPVTIECSAEGAVIQTDFLSSSSIPGTSRVFSTGLTTKEIPLGASRTIRAYATKSGYQNSATTEASYELYSWRALSSGTDNDVFATAVNSSGDLYIGGEFTTAGGASRSYIAKWNGSAWQALGPGTGGVVYTILSDSTDVYVGGNFLSAGGLSRIRIGKWTGSTWEAMGGGANMQVYALAADDTYIYMGGLFNLIVGNPSTDFSKVARWHKVNGSWEALGTGIWGTGVYALCQSGTYLYAGGDFHTANGTIPVSNIARWNGSSWAALGDGVNDAIRAMAVDSSGYLYVGGDFTTAGGNTANRVAKWDGSSWSSLGSGINGTVNSLAFDDSGNLYAGGNFTSAGGTSVNNIARWNGSTWQAIGSGLDSTAEAIVYYSPSNLYIGGSFTTGEAITSPNVINLKTL